MIQISVDPGYAYDLLSILSVKSDARPSVRPDWDRLAAEIVSQVEPATHAAIMAEIYPLMWATNSALFHFINRLKETNEAIDARETDDLNMRRFRLKQQLQARFFPGEQLAEIKIGYTQ